MVTLHGTDGRILGQNSLTRVLGRRVLRRATLVTAVSPELARTAETVAGRADVSSHVQPMPVDSEGWPWSRGGKGLIVVGRLTSQKRIHLAIQAGRVLAGEGKPLPLTIAGDGPEREQLEREASGVPVRFVGQLSRADLIRELEGADVMLFPARHEGFGLAAIEGLMMGVPVVACEDGGGVVSALRRHGGGVITAPEPAALAHGVREAAGQGPHEEARRAGAQWRAELAPDQVALRFEAWYGETLAG
jgi:glycosyltransferase involved in cell wall biosynthesis